MGKNNNIKIFGSSDDNAISQMAAYNLMSNKGLLGNKQW